MIEKVKASLFQRSQSRGERFAGLLAGVAILPLDDEVCRVFARKRDRLRAARRLVSDFDLLIGSTAIRPITSPCSRTTVGISSGCKALNIVSV